MMRALLFCLLSLLCSFAQACSGYAVSGLRAENSQAIPYVINLSASYATTCGASGTDTVSPVALLPARVDTIGIGGRDQSAAFAPKATVWVYLVKSATSVGTVTSLSKPPTGPTLPSGYTSFAPLFPIVLDNLGRIYPGTIRVRGNEVLLQTAPILDICRPCMDTWGYNIDLSPYAPAGSISIVGIDSEGVYGSGVYGAQGGFLFRPTNTNNNINHAVISVYTPPVQWATTSNFSQHRFALDDDQILRVVFLLNVGTFYGEWPTLTIFVQGYTF